MSKRLIIILALAFVVGITFAAYAEVQNVKVSGDLLIQGVARSNFATTTTTATVVGIPEKQRAIISHARIRIDADLTDNVSTTVRLLNERTWGKEGDTGSDSSTDDTDIDLDLAYATLKEFLYSPLTLVVGRQELSYGSGLIVGDIDANSIATADSNLPATTAPAASPTTTMVGLTDLSVRRAFDAMKAILNYDPLVVDLVYAKIEENTVNYNNDVNLIGINAAYALRKDLSTEAYLWSRDRQYGSTGLTTAVFTPGQGERLNVLGARAVYSGIENLILGLEGAWQFGDHITSAVALTPEDDIRDEGQKSKVNAYAIQITSNYAVPKAQKYSPMLSLNYTRLSGAKPETDSDNYTGWDSMFKDQAGGTIFNKVIGYSNAELFNLGASMKPMEDVTVRLDWYNIALVQPFSPMDTVQILTGILGDPAVTVKPNKKHLANELDLNLIYDYTEDVQLGLNAGLYIPGAVYDKVNKKSATQLIGSMKVTF